MLDLFVVCGASSGYCLQAMCWSALSSKRRHDHYRIFLQAQDCCGHDSEALALRAAYADLEWLCAPEQPQRVFGPAATLARRRL